MLMNETNEVVAEETYGCSELGSKKIYLSQGSHVYSVRVLNRGVNSSWVSIRSFLSEVFLPLGFPDSVSEDYLEYQLWDSLQAFCSSLTGALSTQAILKGAGVGDETATVLSATITWLLKDGAGMLGRIIFAWLKGTELDCNCKKWRLFADVVNDAAIFIDLMSPYFLTYFTPILCASGVLKALVGVSGGATRASLTQHQARRNNMADVSAKDGSQETMVGLMALICSLLMVPLVSGNGYLTWSLFCLLTVMHIFSNYKAVTSVCMESFNTARFKILLKQYFKNGSLMSVGRVNKLESVWFTLGPEKVEISVGASLSDFLGNIASLTFYRDLFKDCGYILHITQRFPSRFKICLALQQNCNAKTILEAMYQAVLIESALTGQLPEMQEFQQINYICRNRGIIDTQNLTVLSRKLTEDSFDNFYNRVVNSIWITDYVLFEAKEFRFKWRESSI